MSPSQGRFLHTEQHIHKKKAHRHQCLEWDSNSWSQCSSWRRHFMLFFLIVIVGGVVQLGPLGWSCNVGKALCMRCHGADHEVTKNVILCCLAEVQLYQWTSIRLLASLFGHRGCRIDTTPECKRFPIVPTRISGNITKLDMSFISWVLKAK
jgi:hypothetical protein